MARVLLPDATGDSARIRPRLDALSNTGEPLVTFLVPALAATPGACIDGRIPAGTDTWPHAKWPGTSLGVSLALTTLPDGPTHAEVLDALAGAGPLAAHTDTHAGGDAHAGCAAVANAARLPLASVAGALPVLAPLIAEAGAAHLDGLRAPTPVGPHDELPDHRCDVLAGEHVEGAFLVNLRPGTTLDTAALVRATGGAASAFCWDAWLVEPLVTVLAPRLGLAPERVRGVLLAWGLGVAHLLWAPDLPLTVLD